MYTRLGDDIVFSSDTRIAPAHGGQILEFITGAGLKISHKKTHYWDLKKVGEVHIHGIGLRNRKFAYQDFKNKKGELEFSYARLRGELFVPRSYKVKLEGLLHSAMYGKLEISRSKIGGHMGVFFSIQKGNLYSAQDRKIFNAWKLWQKMLTQ